MQGVEQFHFIFGFPVLPLITLVASFLFVAIWKPDLERSMFVLGFSLMVDAEFLAGVIVLAWKFFTGDPDFGRYIGPFMLHPFLGLGAVYFAHFMIPPDFLKFMGRWGLLLAMLILLAFIILTSVVSVYTLHNGCWWFQRPSPTCPY